MNGLSQNILPKIWAKRSLSVQVAAKAGPGIPLKSSSEKKKVSSKISIPADAGRCLDIDVNIGSEVKIIHNTRQKTKIFGYCLLVAFYSAVMYGLFSFELESRLTLTNQRFNALQKQIRWMAVNYRLLNRKVLAMSMSLDQLIINKQGCGESSFREADSNIVQFSDINAMTFPSSAPFVSALSDVTLDQSDTYLGRNLTFVEYDEALEDDSSQSDDMGGNVTIFQSVYNESNADSALLNFTSDYDSVSVEEFDEDRKDNSADRPNRVKRSNRRGPVAAHFKGGQLETVIRDGGLIAPWYPDDQATGDFGFSAYEFREGMGAVEVSETGLYLLYAQAYYLTNESLNSFTINVMSPDMKDTPVAVCSTSLSLASAGSVTEASCFTSVVRFLNATTLVTLKQRERNRRMILREGFTFLGIVKLNSQQPPGKGRRGN